MERNPASCGGPENIDNGCLEIFHRRSLASTLCHKCKKLNASEISEGEYAAIKGLIQCMECGLCGRNISDPCGTCKRMAAEDRGERDAGKVQAAAARKSLFDQSVGRPGIPSSKPLNQSHAFGPATSEFDLTMIRAAPTQALWTIFYLVRRKGTVDSSLGSGTLTFPSNTLLSTVTERITAQVSTQWVRMEGHTTALKPSHCDLRFANNVTIINDAKGYTIKELFDHYTTLPEKALVLNDGSKLKLAKGTSLTFELFIREKEYDKDNTFSRSHDSDDDDDEHLTGKKRKSRSTGGSSTGKRRAQGTILTTSFASRRSSAISIPREVTDPITFSTVWCEIMPETGKEHLVETSEIVSGYIGLEQMQVPAGSEGRSKEVYTLRIGSRTYVAKKFFDVGLGPGNGLDANEHLLIRDLIRLKTLDFFVGLFQKLSAKESVEIADFRVSEGFVITCRTRKGVMDNTAYLVEPMRSSSEVIKFSGTLGTSNRTDKTFATMSAFAHFVLFYSACRISIADLQGSMHVQDGRVPILTLFDPMTHSLYGHSGLGDLDTDGIQDLITNHVCPATCHRFHFPTTTTLQATLADALEERTTTLEEEDIRLENGEKVDDHGSTFEIHHPAEVDNQSDA